MAKKNATTPTAKKTTAKKKVATKRTPKKTPAKKATKKAAKKVASKPLKSAAKPVSKGAAEKVAEKSQLDFSIYINMIAKLCFLPFLLLRIVAYPFGHRWHKAKLRDTWSGDGDSFWIVTTKGEVFQIRLLGIDCPEHSQPFGAEAGDRRKLLCGDQTFKVRCRGRDVYGRWLSSVTLPKGGNLAICLLNEGMAHDTGKVPQAGNLVYQAQ